MTSKRRFSHKISQGVGRLVIAMTFVLGFALSMPLAAQASTASWINVFGQPDFTSSAHALTQSGEYNPASVSLDVTGHRLFVADDSNNRVLVYDTTSITNGEPAAHVLGQPDFTSSGNALTQSGMFSPAGVLYDSVGQRLFVSDQSNDRVLVYDLSGGITDGMNAAYVLGQANFTTDIQGTTQSSWISPGELGYDSGSQTLFLVDYNDRRVLTYDLSGGITNGMPASHVIGQANFTSRVVATTQTGLGGPEGVVYDATGQRLFVSDAGGSRVLEYDLSGGISDDMPAEHVLGQPDFTTSTPSGAPDNSHFSQFPFGLAYNAAGHTLYVADLLYQRILSFDLTGGITDGMAATGVYGQPDFISGGAAAGRQGLDFPFGIAYDPTGTGTLYIGDFNNNRIVTYGFTSPEAITDLAASPGDTSATLTWTAPFDGNSAITGYDVHYSNDGFSSDDETCTDASCTDATAGATVPGLTNGVLYTFHVYTINSIGTSAVSNDATTTPHAPTVPDAITDLAASPGDTAVALTWTTPYDGGSFITSYDVHYSDDGFVSNDQTCSTTSCTDTSAGATVTGLTDGVLYTFHVFTINGIGPSAVSNDATATPNVDTAPFWTHVIGRPDFTSSAAATTQDGMSCPSHLSEDVAGHRLFIADECNARVLVYDTASITDGQPAAHVLGQLDFTSDGPALTQSGMSGPNAVLYDAAGQRLFVADYLNNRVLVYDLSGGITDGMPAAHVLGQPDFVTSAALTDQSTMSSPYGLGYDSATQTLFVADNGNSRVLTYDLSGGITDGMPASHVIGEPDFATNIPATTQAGMGYPESVLFDAADQLLFVSDTYGDRVLTYDLSGGIADSMPASHVIGQPDFTTVNPTGTPSDSNFNYPNDMAHDSSGHRLFVADGSYNRVLSFDISGGVSDGMAATAVYGQPDFSSQAPATSQQGLNFPYGVAYDSTGSGTLFVADDANSRVVTLGFAPPPLSGPTNATTFNSVLMSRLKHDATSDVTVNFGIPVADAPMSGLLTVTFPSGFTVNTDPTLGASSSCLGTFGHTSSTVFAAKTSCSGAIFLGGFSVTNPSTPGTYHVSWVNDDPGGADVYIMIEDQISMTATVDPSITFDVGSQTATCDGTFASSAYAVAFGSISPSSVSYSDNGGVQHICTKLSTNATGGAIVTVENANGASGLKSASVPGDVIPSASGSMSAGAANYGLCATSVSGLDTTTPTGATPTNGSFSASSCGTGTATIVPFTGSAQTAWTTSGPVADGFYQFDLNAEASATTPAHSDYADTLTWIATGTF